MVLETKSALETYELGRLIGERVVPGTIVCMTGDLGVGKTVFTQGFARGLGVDEPINSPTFTIVQEYHSGRLPLYHFDVYRIGDITEMDELGYEEYFYGDGVSLVEWGNLISELFTADTINVVIEKSPDRGFEYRKITIDGADDILALA